MGGRGGGNQRNGRREKEKKWGIGQMPKPCPKGGGSLGMESREWGNNDNTPPELPPGATVPVALPKGRA